MSKSTRNSGTGWSDGDVSKLQKLADGNTPTPFIGLKLGRSESAVYSKASREGIDLTPTNQKPYNRRK